MVELQLYIKNNTTLSSSFPLIKFIKLVLWKYKFGQLSKIVGGDRFIFHFIILKILLSKYFENQIKHKILHPLNLAVFSFNLTFLANLPLLKRFNEGQRGSIFYITITIGRSGINPKLKKFWIVLPVIMFYEINQNLVV